MAPRSCLLLPAAGLLCASTVSGLRVGKEAVLEHPELDSEIDMDLVGFHRMLTQGFPAALNASRLRVLADLQSGRPALPEEEKGYDCKSLPHMCEAPFHCDNWTHQDTLDVQINGLAKSDGHPNLRTWCMPGLERYASTVVKECFVNQNSVTSAEDSLSEPETYSYADNLDASYCFAEGHCTNALVSEATTLAHMEKMCDYRFGGRQGWTRNLAKPLKRLAEMPTSSAHLVSAKSGFSAQSITRVMAKMACAQGMWHCDVQYCRRRYCWDPVYNFRYAHLSPPVPGHFLTDPDVTQEVRDA